MSTARLLAAGVTVAVLLNGCGVVGRTPDPRARSGTQCRWNPTSLRLSMDSVLTVTDSEYVCRKLAAPK